MDGYSYMDSSRYLYNMDLSSAGRPAVVPFKSFVASNKQRNIVALRPGPRGYKM